MAIFPGSAIPTSGAAEYSIDQSLRFEDGSSAYLSRTPASAGNRKTMTWSTWVKRGNIPVSSYYIGGGPTGAAYFVIGFSSSGVINIEEVVSSANTFMCRTSALYRDPSAWYHIVFTLDTTQATSTDRMHLYVNGVEVSYDTYSAPSQNMNLTYFNNTSSEKIGASPWSYFDGYLSEVHFIDGQALTPDYFGEVDATYGHWKPIRYTGTYGTNGFYLPFSGTFYNDASGNGNNWTANNLATTDVVLDSPTNNFATLNPLWKSSNTTVQEGNLYLPSVSYPSNILGTMGVSSGKWYFEARVENNYGSYTEFGIAVTDDNAFLTQSGSGLTGAISWHQFETVRIEGVNQGTTSPNLYNTSTKIVGCAVDLDNNKVYFHGNGTWVNSSNPSTGTGGYSIPASMQGKHITALLGPNNVASSPNTHANFGQDSSFSGAVTAQNNTDDNGYGDFYYPVPSGFLSLCSANLSDPAVVPGENFDVHTYAGAAAVQTFNSFAFSPDLLWWKVRSAINSHAIVDRVRGEDLEISSNLTSGETDYTADDPMDFVANGFAVNNSNFQKYNRSGETYVTWMWKADNTSGSTNTDGSITSTVAANPDAGFSIVSYTGNGSAGSTVGHGLSQAPEVIIVKDRTSAESWHVYHGAISNMASGFLRLNSTNAFSTASDGIWYNSNPTSSVFTIGFDSGVNTSSDNYIAYAFHSVDGYSKFGSYTGNGSTDGPFVYTGFRPRWIMVKRTDGDPVYAWLILDTERDPYNVSEKTLFPNTSAAENTSLFDLDILSNGFKWRSVQTSENASGGTYIYMAFAEYPFKFSTAR